MFLQRGQFMLKVQTRRDILPRNSALLYSLFLNRPEDAFSPAGFHFPGLHSWYPTDSGHAFALTAGICALRAGCG
jgi:hypothetical protein